MDSTHFTLGDPERLSYVRSKLNAFLEQKKIPHILFHGMPGTGKKTIVFDFLKKIFQDNKEKMKSNVMIANCAHGKGIKFIREDLKFFAKTNIRHDVSQNMIPFKIIVLLNADYLTIDAQSALRRCIELFSQTTRFFLIVEKKHRLLHPIVSRFCPLFIPEMRTIQGKVVNLHLIPTSILDDENQKKKDPFLIQTMMNLNSTTTDLCQISNQLYQRGYCALDVETCWNDIYPDNNQNVGYLDKIQSEYRCEPMLIFAFLVQVIYERENKVTSIE